jgi:hypothetical protein
MRKACLYLFLLVLSLTLGQTASITTAELPTAERQPAPNRTLALHPAAAWGKNSVPLWSRVSWRKAHPPAASGDARYPQREAATPYLGTGPRSGADVRVHFFRPNQVFTIAMEARPEED